MKLDLSKSLIDLYASISEGSFVTVDYGGIDLVYRCMKFSVSAGQYSVDIDSRISILSVQTGHVIWSDMKEFVNDLTEAVRRDALMVGLPMLTNDHIHPTGPVYGTEKQQSLFFFHSRPGYSLGITQSRITHCWAADKWIDGPIPHHYYNREAVKRIGLKVDRFGLIGSDEDWIIAITDHHVDPVLRDFDIPLAQDFLGQINQLDLSNFDIEYEPDDQL